MPASHFELALRQFGTTAFLRKEMLAGTGVDAGQLSVPGAEVTLGQQLRQLRNLNQLRPEGGWALLLGPIFHPSTHGPVGFAAMSAPTLGDALDLIARFLHVRNPSHRGESTIVGDEYRLALAEQVALLDEERVPIGELFLLSIQGLVESVLARPLVEARFEFAFPAPPWARRYREVFHSKVRFEASRSALVIPAALRAERSPLADPGVHATALPTLEALARRMDGLDFTAARLEQILIQGGDTPVSLAASARQLGLSRRTLIRRLHEAGTSYREVGDLHRRRRAEVLLRDGNQGVAEIAYRLGYQDATSFGRACRRWFGATPRELRQQLCVGAPKGI